MLAASFFAWRNAYGPLPSSAISNRTTHNLVHTARARFTRRYCGRASPRSDGAAARLVNEQEGCQAKQKEVSAQRALKGLYFTKAVLAGPRTYTPTKSWL